MAALVGVIAEGGVVAVAVEPVHMLLKHLLVAPMAASLLPASNKFAWRPYWRVKLRQMAFRSSGRQSCWTYRSVVGTSWAARRSRNRIVQVERTRRSNSGAGDREELLEMLLWKAVWLLVLGESFVCRSYTVP